MKKLTLILVITALLAALLMSGAAASADGLDIADGDIEGGESLDFGLRISYNNLYHKYGSVERSFVVTVGDAMGADAEGKQKTLEGCAALLGEIGYKIKTEGNTTTAAALFDSLTDLYVALGIDGFEKPDDSGIATTRQNAFYMQSISTQTSVFDGWESNLIGEMVALATENGINDVQFEYNFGVRFGKTRLDTNADVKVFDEELGIYIHTFLGLYENSAREIVVTQSYPNINAWYGLSIAIGAAMLGIGIGAIQILKNSRR